MLRQVFIFIPLVYLLPMIANLRSVGIFMGFGITDMVVLFIAIVSVSKVFKKFPIEHI